jgi:phosphoglucosamine mutase
MFSELGATVSAIGNRPDGLNINRECGSTSPATLARAVVDAGADLGVAFDGDGDRLQMVDGNGRIVDGDELLYILAVDWHGQGRLKGPVVGTLMTNLGLEQAMATLGVPFLRSKVGDRHVMQALREHAGVLGGETSGHILCLDRVSTGDAIVSALQILEALARSGRSLAESVSGMSKVPQTTVNIHAKGGASLVADADVQRVLASVQAQLAGRGRVVLRPSGTEPLVRVTVEASDPQTVSRLVDELADAVRGAQARVN